jgi:hypothetical protein
MVRLCDVVIDLFLAGGLGFCMASASGAVILDGGVGTGVRNCCGCPLLLCVLTLLCMDLF